MATPVTRAELESLLARYAERIEGHTDAELRSVTEQLRGEMQQLEQRLGADIERIETSLLTEFHQWARTHELRERGSLSLLATFDDRLRHTEDRVAEIERSMKERRPPAA
jgi:hypothetical protein